MPLAEINWKHFLEPGSVPPPDVFFTILEDQPSDAVSELEHCMGVSTISESEVLEDPAEDSVESSGTSPVSTQSTVSSQLTSKLHSTQRVVSAHKFLLAATSSVFGRQFYGPLRENSNEIVVKETTFEAFSTMINYIYIPPGESFSLDHLKDPQSLCEIYNIGERYQLEELKLIAFKVLSALPINSENLISTAVIAKHWSAFPEVSEKLLQKCTNYINQEMKTAKDVYKLMFHTKENCQDADSDLLFELLRNNAGRPKTISENTCTNCKRKLDNCVDGQYATGLEDPPILEHGVMVKTLIAEHVFTIQSLHHEKEELEEVDTFPKNGDPLSFSVKVQPTNEVFP